MEDEVYQELERRMSEVEAQMHNAFVRISTRAGVSHCLAILQDTPWQLMPNEVASVIRPAQQNLARAIIIMDKDA